MKKHYRIYITTGGLLLSILVFIVISKKNALINAQKCEAIGFELNGLIDAKGGNGSLSWVHLSNRKDGIVLMINKTIYKSGFAQNYSFNIGDSLIKKAGSNEFTIKRNKNIAIYQIDCDGYR